MEGAVPGPILQLRHSPGMTRRKATRATTETGCESESSVREVSCFVPLHRLLHAVCQHGAWRKISSPRSLPLTFEMPRNSCKAHAISVLPIIDFRDSWTQWGACAGAILPRKP